MNKLYNDTAVQAIANAIRAKNGSSDTYTIAEMSTALNDISYYAKPIISNVPLATFEADGLPLNSLKVSVEAQQDLHGYDKPWVGGAGKNKLPLVLADIKANNLDGTWSGNDFTGNGVTFTILTDESDDVIGVKATGTASADATLYLYGGTTSSSNDIVFSESFIGSTEVAGSSSTVRGIIWGTNGAYIDGSETTFNAMTVYGFGIRVMSGYSIPSGGVTFKPMLRLATSASGFAPYTNICPISGRDAAKVSDVGKNLCNKADFNTTQTLVYKPMYVGEGTFTFSTSCPPTSGTTVKDIFILGGNVDTGADSATNGVSSTTPRTVTAVDGYITIASRYNSARNNPADYDWMLVKGSEVATYEPYINQTTTISLGQTVYGGEVDVVNGVLKITDGYIASYNGETLPSTWISSMDVYAEGTTPTTGAEVCYELAEPIIINLTPSLIKSLNGINNLSVDCGEIIELEYFKEV